MADEITKTTPELRARSAPIIERSPLPIIEVQGRSHIVSYVNSAFCSLLEKSRSELIGKSFCDIVPRGEECVPVLDRVYETGEAVTLAKKDEAEPSHWMFAMWPALDEKERPVGVIIQLTKAQIRPNLTEVNEALLVSALHQQEMTDQAEHLNSQLKEEIADRKQTEEKLRASEMETQRARDYAEATLRTAPIPLVVLRTDLRVNTTNEAFCKTFQVEPGESEGQMIYNLGNGQWNIPELRILLEEILPKNNSFNDFEVTHNFENLGRRTMLLNARRMENEAGQPLRIVLAIEDITQRKHAEKALRQSEERYRNLFNSIDEGFCVIEMIFDGNENAVDYRFLEVNPSFEQQSGLRNVLGKRMREMVSDIEEHWLVNYGNVALTGQPIRFVNEYKALEGRWFDVYAFRVGEPQSRKVAVIFTDITARKQAEEVLHQSRVEISQHAAKLEQLVGERTAALKESVHSLESLNYTMAHDLRAPIRAMKGLTTCLLEDVPLDETGKSFAKRINKAAERMDQLVNDLLKYGELTHQEFPIKTVSPKTEVENVLAELADEIQSTHAEIHLQEPMPLVSASERLVHQIFSNLISNGLKFVNPGMNPKILIRAEPRDKSTVRIWVEDSGLGIALEHQERIFGVFQRLHTTEEFPGTGVGLAIIRRAAERMGGRVGLESELGRGSKFWIDLPKANESAGSGAAKENAG